MAAPAGDGALGREAGAAVPPRVPTQAVRRSSVRGQVLAALRAALLDGELAAGEVYSAPGIGRRLGVSATPVREAMQQLAAEGAVEVVPNRGYRIAAPGERELADLAEVRLLIEVPVLLRLARTVPARAWAELRPAAEATALAATRGDRVRYAEADLAFHRAVLALCGNDQLVRTAQELHRRAQWPPGSVRAELLADAAQHSALLDALSEGDTARVEAVARHHVEPRPARRPRP
ncbi:GntR family transcriptional regulator [Streptomyces sp. NPDC050560]|uniref:GntR family transcriptional regulator n=1 Tax=Streptomyces sp. NPDC050560 TaxID=3365630 RepID=UPI0037885FF5